MEPNKQWRNNITGSDSSDHGGGRVGYSNGTARTLGRYGAYEEFMGFFEDAYAMGEIGVNPRSYLPQIRFDHAMVFKNPKYFGDVVTIDNNMSKYRYFTLELMGATDLDPIDEGFNGKQRYAEATFYTAETAQYASHLITSDQARTVGMGSNETYEVLRYALFTDLLVFVDAFVNKNTVLYGGTRFNLGTAGTYAGIKATDTLSFQWLLDLQQQYKIEGFSPEMMVIVSPGTIGKLMDDPYFANRGGFSTLDDIIRKLEEGQMSGTFTHMGITIQENMYLPVVSKGTKEPVPWHTRIENINNNTDIGSAIVLLEHNAMMPAIVQTTRKLPGTDMAEGRNIFEKTYGDAVAGDILNQFNSVGYREFHGCNVTDPHRVISIRYAMSSGNSIDIGEDMFAKQQDTNDAENELIFNLEQDATDGDKVYTQVKRLLNTNTDLNLDKEVLRVNALLSDTYQLMLIDGNYKRGDLIEDQKDAEILGDIQSVKLSTPNANKKKMYRLEATPPSGSSIVIVKSAMTIDGKRKMHVIEAINIV